MLCGSFIIAFQEVCKQFCCLEILQRVYLTIRALESWLENFVKFVKVIFDMERSELHSSTDTLLPFKRLSNI